MLSGIFGRWVSQWEKRLIWKSSTYLNLCCSKNMALSVQGQCWWCPVHCLMWVENWAVQHTWGGAGSQSWEIKEWCCQWLSEGCHLFADISIFGIKTAITSAGHLLHSCGCKQQLNSHNWVLVMGEEESGASVWLCCLQDKEMLAQVLWWHSEHVTYVSASSSNVGSSAEPLGVSKKGMACLVSRNTRVVLQRLVPGGCQKAIHCSVCKSFT